MYEEGGGSLKVSYRKQLSIINYEPMNRYEEIMKLIMQQFKIPATHERALLISTENGRIFEKQLFDYFLTLFPNPSVVFYIRYDYNRAISILQPLQQQQQQHDEEINPDADINMENIQRKQKERKKNMNINNAKVDRIEELDDGEDDDYSCKCTPVFRMNCFIYEYPTTSQLKPATTATTPKSDNAKKHKYERSNKQSPRIEFVKRVRKHLQIAELKARTRKPLAQVKRIMRL